MKVDPEFDNEFDYEYVGSHANKELVLCHRPDRTLIEAEYVLPESIFPLLDHILSPETSLESIYSLDMFYSSMCPPPSLFPRYRPY